MGTTNFARFGAKSNSDHEARGLVIRPVRYDSTMILTNPIAKILPIDIYQDNRAHAERLRSRSAASKRFKPA